MIILIKILALNILLALNDERIQQKIDDILLNLKHKDKLIKKIIYIKVITFKFSKNNLILTLNQYFQIYIM